MSTTTENYQEIWSATAATRRMRNGRMVRIAVQFVLGYEEGGENNPLHGDPTSETLSLRSDHRRPGLRKPAHDHGVDVRVRLARGRVAHPAGV